MANIRDIKSKRKGKFNKASGKHASEYKKGALKKEKALQKTLKSCKKNQVFFVKQKKGGLNVVYSRRIVKRARKYRSFYANNKLHIHAKKSEWTVQGYRKC